MKDKHLHYRLMAIALVAGLFALSAIPEVHAATVFGYHLFAMDPTALAAVALMGPVIDVTDPAAVTAELKRIGDSVKEEGTKALQKAEKAEQLTIEQKGRIDELLSKQGEMQTVLLDIAQKAAAKGAFAGGGDQAEEKSIGQQVVDSEEFKNLVKGGGTRGKFAINIAVKAVTTVSSLTSGTGGVGAMVRPDRIDNPMMTPGLRRMTIRDLIAPGRTTSNMIEYLKESGFQNMAGIVADGALKPQSDLSMALVQSAVATIAHWLRATKIILDDAPQLQSYIDTRLRYGLKLVEEAQLLNGSGSGGNLNGLYTQASAYAAPFSVPGETSIDRVRLAILQVEVAEYPCTGVVMNPLDWAFIELLKDADGRYLIGNPQGSISPRLWNRDVIATNAMPADSFLTGAFSLASQIFDREDANVLISTEDQDNFVRNLITIRAEERLALADFRPEAFVKGDFGRIA